METTIVLLIFFFIISLGIIFFIAHQKSTAREKQVEFENLELVKQSQVLSFFPELQCSNDGVINSNCYDTVKIEKFGNIYQANKLFYNSLFGYMKAEVVEFDPSPAVNSYGALWVIYDNAKEDYSAIRKVEQPVVIYDPINNEKTFGIINLSIYK